MSVWDELKTDFQSFVSRVQSVLSSPAVQQIENDVSDSLEKGVEELIEAYLSVKGVDISKITTASLPGFVADVISIVVSLVTAKFAAKLTAAAVKPTATTSIPKTS